MWHEKLGTTLIVIALTGLIWFFADQANKDSKTIKLSVAVQTRGNVVVLGQDPASLDFEVTVSAPRSVISEIEKQAQGKPLAANLVLDENVGTGKQTFTGATVARMLAQLDVVQKLGLAISDPRPDTFTLNIDRLEVLPSVRIKPEFPGLSVDYEVPNPSTCKVRLPQSLKAKLAGEVLPVEVSPPGDATQSSGDITRSVTLRWPSDDPGWQFVQFEPASFSVKFRLKDTTSKRRFEIVQVYYYGMPDVLDRYRIERPDKVGWRYPITVSGPKQLVESLQNDDIMLFVKIVPDDENSVGKRIRRTATVKLPPGVQMEGTPPEVDFVLQDCTMTAATGG